MAARRAADAKQNRKADIQVRIHHVIQRINLRVVTIESIGVFKSSDEGGFGVGCVCATSACSNRIIIHFDRNAGISTQRADCLSLRECGGNVRGQNHVGPIIGTSRTIPSAQTSVLRSACHRDREGSYTNTNGGVLPEFQELGQGGCDAPANIVRGGPCGKRGCVVVIARVPESRVVDRGLAPRGLCQRGNPDIRNARQRGCFNHRGRLVEAGELGPLVFG